MYFCMRIWEAKARQASRDSDCIKAVQKLPPRSLSPALMTGLDGEPSPDTPRTHSRRGAAHRSKKPGKEERCRLMLPAVPVSPHARTVPGPARLGSDSTATSVPMADGSNACERHHRFRWTATMTRTGSDARICRTRGGRLTAKPLGCGTTRKTMTAIVAGVCLLVGCLMSQQHASVSQGRICSDNFTCCHTEIEVADPTFYLTQSQYTDTGPTSPSADPLTPGAWQGNHWSANV